MCTPRYLSLQECVRQGKLAGEASAHAANLTDRDRAIRDAALALALPLPEQQPQQGSEGVQQHLSCAAAESFVGAVGGKVRQLEARVNALRADARWVRKHGTSGHRGVGCRG